MSVYPSSGAAHRADSVFQCSQFSSGKHTYVKYIESTFSAFCPVMINPNLAVKEAEVLTQERVMVSEAIMTTLG